MKKISNVSAVPPVAGENLFSELNINKRQLIAIYLSIAILYIVPNLFSIFSAMGWDESNYMGAVKMVLDGKLPYRDFFWYHTPGFLYLNSLVAYFFGLELIPLRLFAFAFGVSGIILLGLISYKLGGHFGAIIALSLSATSYLNSDYLSAIYFSSFTNLFLLSALCFHLFLKSNFLKLSLISAALVICFSIRSTTLISILVYGIFLLLAHQNGIKRIVLYASNIVIFLILIFGYFLFFIPDEFLTGISALRAKVYPSWGHYFNLPRQIFHFFYIMSDYPVLFVGILSMSVYFGIDRRNMGFSFMKSDMSDENLFIGLVSLLLFSLASFEIIFVSYPTRHHILYYFPLMVILISWYYKPYLIKGLNGSASWHRLTIVFIGISLFVSYFCGPMNLFLAIRTMKKEYNHSSTKQMKMIGQEIKKITSPKEKIFSFIPIFGVYSERDLLPGLEVGYSAYSPIWTEAEVKKYHVCNFELIREYFENKSASVVIITDVEKLMAPFQEKYKIKNSLTFWKDFYFYLNRNYKILFTRKIDDYFWGTAVIYVPK